MKYGLKVFREGTVTHNDLHGERCNRLLTQMSGCNILLNHNLWLRIKKNQFGTGTSVILNQPQEISSPKLVKSRRRDVIGGIQPKFVY